MWTGENAQMHKVPAVSREYQLLSSSSEEETPGAVGGGGSGPIIASVPPQKTPHLAVRSPATNRVKPIPPPRTRPTINPSNPSAALLGSPQLPRAARFHANPTVRDCLANLGQIYSNGNNDPNNALPTNRSEALNVMSSSQHSNHHDYGRVSGSQLAKGQSLDRKLTDMQRMHFGELLQQKRAALDNALAEFQFFCSQAIISQPLKPIVFAPTDAPIPEVPKSSITEEEDERETDSHRPPTPPQHRGPKWEGRGSYSVTNTPLRMPRANHNYNHALVNYEIDDSRLAIVMGERRSSLSPLPRDTTATSSDLTSTTRSSKSTENERDDSATKSLAQMTSELSNLSASISVQRAKRPNTLSTSSSLQLYDSNPLMSSSHKPPVKSNSMDNSITRISYNNEEDDDGDDYDIPPDAMESTGSTPSSPPPDKVLHDLKHGLKQDIEFLSPRRFSSFRAAPISKSQPPLMSPILASKNHQTPSQSTPLPVSSQVPNVRKSGYLSKLSGRLKLWQKRWFELQGNTFTYYKSQSDSIRGLKPRGQIPLTSFEVTRPDMKSTSFQVHLYTHLDNHKEHTYYLAADNFESTMDWVKTLNIIAQGSSNRMSSKNSSANLQKDAKEGTSQQSDANKIVMEGWLTRVRHGHSKKVWATIMGRILFYYKSPCEPMPIGQVNLKHARVEEQVCASSDSDHEEPSTTSNPAAFPAAMTGSFHSDFGTPTHSPAPDPDVTLFTVKIIPKPIRPITSDSTPSADSKLEPTYLLIENKIEFDQWLFHLTVLSCHESDTGTPFEQLVNRLITAECDAGTLLDNHPLWRDLLFLYTKNSTLTGGHGHGSGSISGSSLSASGSGQHSPTLTTLVSDELKSEAIKLFHSIQLFITVPLDSSGIDYHVSLVQNSLQLCLERPELRSELFSQLIKQTSPHVTHRVSSTCGEGNSLFSFTTPSGSIVAFGSPQFPSFDKSNPSGPHVFIQGFQFLALACSLFVPTKCKILWFLKRHLSRAADTKTEMGKYAIYCSRAIERTQAVGGRHFRPSRMEVLSIILRNPFHHSLPHSIPVNINDATNYTVFGFDGSTTIQELIEQLVAHLKAHPSKVKSADGSPYPPSYGLYADDPIRKDTQHLISSSINFVGSSFQLGGDKLADTLAKWEMVLRDNRPGRIEHSRIAQLTYKPITSPGAQ